MKQISIQYPRKLVFGIDAFNTFVEDLLQSPFQRVFIVTISEIIPVIDSALEKIRKGNHTIVTDTTIRSEPTYSSFHEVLENALDFEADVVVGIGGGSSLDVAKLVAAQLKNEQSLEEIVGIGNLKKRETPLICLPTTSGTGSEVSPNAILLDEQDQLKKGVISPHLMPDASYVDPKLTLTVPPQVTAATGMDALIHCIEAYTNKFAHPMIDTLVLEGIKLIGRNLITAVNEGNNLDARSSLALGSMYGGMSLGPVNTAAVHALSYPLGGEFHIPHGVSNAVLLPYIMKFNIPAAVQRYADVAVALGIEPRTSPEDTAHAGVEFIFNLLKACGLPSKLSELNIPRSAISRMAEGAMKVTRLLKNNPRPLTLEEAINIYQEAY